MSKILDVYGQPLQSGRSVSMYGQHAASLSRQAFMDWFVQSLSPDVDITRNLRLLRARSRDLFMGSALASGAVKTIRSGVVGSGLMLSSHIDRKVLGLSEQEAAEWCSNTEREWRNWAESNECDASGHMNFYQLQALVLLSALMNGDVFIGLPSFSRRGSERNLRLYLIESDRVCNPYWLVDTPEHRTIEGVELGAYDEAAAYYVSKYHPGGEYAVDQSWVKIPAFDARSGRPNILHIMQDIERVGQRRGVPVLAGVMEAFKQLDKYTKAELTAAVVSGMFSVFITTQDYGDGTDMFANTTAAAELPITPRKEDAVVGNGSVVHLNPGETVSTATPGRPNSNFGGFVESVGRQIGAALGIPYELLVKHFTASYSAARASMLEAWKMYRMRRQWLSNQFCDPVYEVWLSEAVASGRIKAPGFFKNETIRKAWLSCEWNGDAQGQIDPRGEVEAAVTRINNGLSTRKKEAAELTGLNDKDIMEERAHDLDAMKRCGLPSFDLSTLSSAPGSSNQKTSGTGAGAGEDEPDTDQEHDTEDK